MERQDGARESSRAPSLSFLRMEIDADQPPLAHLGPMVGRAVEWPDVIGQIGVRTALHASGASVEVVGVAHFGVDGSDVVLAWPVPGRPESEVRSTFERSVIPLALTYHGAQYLHASAVLTAAGVLAICGRSGTGKSTMAAALQRRGYELWGDDAVVFACEQDREPPSSLRLRSPLRLDDEGRRMVDATRPVEAAPTAGDIQPLGAVVILVRGEEPEPQATVLSAGEAVSAVLEHALCLSLDDPATRRGLVSDYLTLVASVPVLRLVFAPDRERIGSLVDLLVAQLGSETASTTRS